SGTNQWHGDVFEYLRNSALDAKNFFEEKKGPFKRNQFGGTLGGPLKKDKVFVFGNYEGFRQRLAQSTRAIYPDLQSRQGLLPCYLAFVNAQSSCADRAAFVPVPNLKQGMLPYAKTFWPPPNGPEPAIPKNLIFLEGSGPGSVVIGGGATTTAPSSVTPAPGNNPYTGINEYYSLADDLRFTKGKHSYSAGVWVQRVHENSFGAAQFLVGGCSSSTMLA